MKARPFVGAVDAPTGQIVKAPGPDDLVIVALDDGRGGTREYLAHLVALGDTAQVRLWRPAAQSFAAPRLVPRAAVVRKAAEDARAKLAKEQLDLEAKGPRR